MPLSGRPAESADQIQGMLQSIGVADGMEWSLRFSMLLLGVSAGIFVIPIQVYVQETPPADQKGRLIGAMNFATWIGILLSALFLTVMNSVTRFLSGGGDAFGFQFVVFLTLAIMMVPVAFLYRLPSANNVSGSSDS